MVIGCFREFSLKLCSLSTSYLMHVFSYVKDRDLWVLRWSSWNLRSLRSSRSSVTCQEISPKLFGVSTSDFMGKRQDAMDVEVAILDFKITDVEKAIGRF